MTLVAAGPAWAVLRGSGYALAGGAVIVGMSMAVVLVDDVPRKAAAIVLAIAGVWLLSRAGAIFYRLLFGLPE